jgi:orotidine-5'-phosphate decarboxylase
MPTQDVLEFNKAIVDATHDLVCAYKPNLAFYEALDIHGLEVLKGTVEYIRQRAPGVVLIADAKRGDIGNTSGAYAQTLFKVWGFDAATINPYLGGDSVEPFLAYEDRGVFLLCRTSNPGARDLQDLPVHDDGEPVYLHVARKAREWNTHGNACLVVGATYPDELKRVRAICPDMPILLPGVGAQAGDLASAVRNGVTSEGRLAIVNSSRGVLYASEGPDFARVARQAAETLRNDINQVLSQEGKGWS